MSITVLSDVIMPSTLIAAGVRGTQRRKNTRVSTHGGHITANVGWDRTLRQYELGFIPMAMDLWAQIEGLHEVTDGGAYGFLMQDPKDLDATHATGVLRAISPDGYVGIGGLGYGVPEYQLAKRFTSTGSTRFKDRSVTRPMAGAALRRGGAAVTIGASPGNASLNINTGRVVFVANASSSITGLSVGLFTVDITLSGTLAGLVTGKRLYVDGISGTGSENINQRSYAITNVAGTTYTIAAEWLAYSLSVSGTGFAYPQESETLTWQGGMYVPVHFASDDIDWELARPGAIQTRLISGPSIILDEVRE